MNEVIFSKSINAGGQTYFFDVKQAQGGKQSKYIKITATRITKDQQHFRSSITLFPEQVKAFQGMFLEAAEKMA